MSSKSQGSPHLWLRSETKANEARSPLTPEGARTLIAKGFTVTVESMPNRIFSDQAFQSAGCAIEPPGSWIHAPKSAWILGLKALPPTNPPELSHQHIYFGHAYKGQEEAKVLLERFRKGGGTLLDLEYLRDNNGRRVAAFGYWAGYVGSALALASWALQNQGHTLAAIQAFKDRPALDRFVAQQLGTSETLPRCIIIGAKGRSGQGGVQCLASHGAKATQWDIDETSRGGPFKEIYEHDILINCVLLSEPTAPFVTTTNLKTTATLKTICDVSCDPYHPFNPLPVYRDNTSFATPSSPILGTDAEIISIDNLPSLLPRESSIDFADQLRPQLLQLPQGSSAWRNAQSTFDSVIHSLPC